MQGKRKDPMPRRKGTAMKTREEEPTVQPAGVVVPRVACTHSRLIDDVLTTSGERTGKVRCLECGAIFDDPYRVQRQ